MCMAVIVLKDCRQDRYLLVVLVELISKLKKKKALGDFWLKFKYCGLCMLSLVALENRVIQKQLIEKRKVLLTVQMVKSMGWLSDVFLVA